MSHVLKKTAIILIDLLLAVYLLLAVTAFNRPDEQSEVWWAGYLFMNLTTAQVRRLMEYLEVKPFIKHVKTITNKDALMMPSGICIEYK